MKLGLSTKAWTHNSGWPFTFLFSGVMPYLTYKLKASRQRGIRFTYPCTGFGSLWKRSWEKDPGPPLRSKNVTGAVMPSKRFTASEIYRLEQLLWKPRKATGNREDTSRSLSPILSQGEDGDFFSTATLKSQWLNKSKANWTEQQTRSDLAGKLRLSHHSNHVQVVNQRDGPVGSSASTELEWRSLRHSLLSTCV